MSDTQRIETFLNVAIILLSAFEAALVSSYIELIVVGFFLLSVGNFCAVGPYSLLTTALFIFLCFAGKCRVL